MFSRGAQIEHWSEIYLKMCIAFILFDKLFVDFEHIIF